MPVTGQIDPAFPCNLECPLCLSEMARRDGYTMPIMKEAELDDILSAYLRGQLSVCLVLGIYYALGLTLLGLDFGLVIGWPSGPLPPTRP